MSLHFSWLEIIEAAYARSGRQKLRLDEICEVIARKKLLPISLSTKDIRKSVGKVISADLQKKETKFARVKNSKTKKYYKGYYRLKEQSQHSVPKPLLVDVSNQFTGAAGEYLVMSELLFRGFNASKMTVDDGIDVVASSDNKYFHIQVKTANERDGGVYSASIRSKTFQHSSDTFYVIVLRSKTHERFVNDYLILPSSIINGFIKKGLLKDGETIALSISKASGKYLLRKSEDVTHLINAFDSIR